MAALHVSSNAFTFQALSDTRGFSVSAAANRLIVLQDKTNSGNYVTGATYNGVAFTGVADTAGFVFWYLIAPASGTNNLVVNCLANGFANILISELAGVDQTTPVNAYLGVGGISASPSSPSITCPVNGLVFGGVHINNAGTNVPTAGAGTTVVAGSGDTVNSQAFAVGYRSDTGALNFILTSSEDWTAHAIPINAAVGGPTAPGAPTIGLATAGNLSASVTFTAPASNGGATITGYTATSSPGGLTGTNTSSPIIITGLTAGTAYTFAVTATNSVGAGAASAASNSVTPAPAATLPGAPTIGALTNNGDGTLTIAGTAPASNGGSTITRYIASSSAGSVQAAAATLPIIIANVSLVAQTVTLKAENSVGIGPASAASNAVTPTTGGGSNIPVNPGAAGTITLPVFKNDAGQSQANLAIASLLVQTLSGITVATFTGLTANASGVLPGQTNANIIIGTTYRVVGSDAAGSEYRNKVAAT